MALEYDFWGAAEVGTEELLAFLVEATGGRDTGFGYVQVDGLQVTAYRVEPEDMAHGAKLFGFTHRVSATFRYDNLATEEVRVSNEALMIRSVLSFLDRYPGAGVLLFNGEEVVLQRLADGADIAAVLNSDWYGWQEEPALGELARQLAAEGVGFQPLPQPLL